MVCHGDRANVLDEVYTEQHKAQMTQDRKAAKYYITRDGKYAVDADYVSAADLESPDLDLTNVPKISLGVIA